MTDPRPRRCDRARLWVSLALDDELSEFERRLLLAHLDRCADCREYDSRVRGTTAALRAQALVPNGRHVVLPRSRAAFGITRLAASTAAAALVAVGVTGFFAVAGQNQRPRLLERISRLQNTEVADVRALRRSQIASQSPSLRPDHIQIASRDGA